MCVCVCVSLSLSLSLSVCVVVEPKYVRTYRSLETQRALVVAQRLRGPPLRVEALGDAVHFLCDAQILT